MPGVPEKASARGNKDQPGLSHRLHYRETLSPPPAGGAQSTNFGIISWHWMRLACSGWPAGFKSTCIWSSKPIGTGGRETFCLSSGQLIVIPSGTGVTMTSGLRSGQLIILPIGTGGKEAFWLMSGQLMFIPTGKGTGGKNTFCLEAKGLLDMDEPRTRLKFGDRAFSISAPRLWNALPQRLKDSTSCQAFKKCLKTHLFRLAHWGVVDYASNYDNV